MKVQTGIWLDFKEAKIIAWNGKESSLLSITSEIEDFHPKGGARSKAPWGPMDKISERKYLERKKQQEKKYFQKIMDMVSDASELYVFGPAEAKHGLSKAIQAKSGFGPVLKEVEQSDSMTDNQMIAKVKAFFNY